MMSRIRKALIAVVVFGVQLSLISCSDSPVIHFPLTARGNIQMPHETSSSPLFDLLTMDPRRAVLYVPHTSNSELHILDTKTQKVTGTINGLPSVRGVALTPDPNVVFATESSGGAVAVLDTAAMKVLATIPVNGSPDAIGYDALDDVVVVTSSGAKQLTIIDRTTRKVKSTVALPGTPELLGLDSAAGVAYVAINDKDEVAAVTIASSQMSELRGCDM